MPAEPQSADFLERIQKLSPKRLALLAAELERRLAAFEQRAADPIAVVGMACRMPGGADTPEAFWTLLHEGVDAIQEVPVERWNAAAVYDPQSGAPGRTNSRWGGFVSNMDAMDAEFFGVSAREAIGMDPQQRLLLEVSWEALENAAIRADRLDGTPTGVFFGISTSDYASLLGQHGVGGLDVYSGSGVARSVAAGRLSYLLGLKGPSFAVDTACSSSALSVHLACQSLRGGECSMALAGGVNALLTPGVTIALSQAHMLSGDGRCKTFSKRADGFVRSEGCGVVVLKRLSDAEAAGDRILGVLRGSATNHDGRSSGLTAPNGPAQAAVIRAALEQARMAPAEVAYLEAHGTGTVLGDAIELGALGTVFAGDARGEALRIGSVKSNLGHLEAAAGIAGLMKLLLAFEQDAIPASLHSRGDDKNLAVQDLPFHIPEQTEAWPAGQRRVAGLSSFGFSGSNVHLVVEAPPEAVAVPHTADATEVLTFSARSAKALRELCARYATFLRGSGAHLALRDVGYTLASGRVQFAHRVAFVAGSVDEAAGRLESLAREGIEGNAAYRVVSGFAAPPVAFLFTGQGSQYAGMGRDLYDRYRVFRDAVDRCTAAAGSLPYALTDILRGEAPPDLIHETRWTQPALFVFEYALAELWRSWGLQPSVVLGHSLGEYVAACVAGVLSLEDALHLTLERGRLMSGLPAGGGMLAVRGGQDAVAPLLVAYADLSIAAANGPRNVVVAGGKASLDRLREDLAALRIVAQPLTVSHAFHSALMDPMLAEFETFAARIQHQPAALPIASNLYGGLLGEGRRIDARYWREHIRSTVRFADGLEAALGTKPAALLEIGPEPVLLGMAKAAHPEMHPVTLPSVRRGTSPDVTLKQTLAQLFLLGAAIDWAAVWGDRPARKVALPTYPFQRERYWLPELASTPAQVTAAQVEANPASVASLLYSTEWVEQPLPTATAEAGDLVDSVMQDAAGSLATTSAQEPLRTVLADYARFVPELNRLCSLYILEASANLGTPLQTGEAFTTEQFLRRGSVLPEHRRLVHRLLSILEEDGIVAQQGGQWIPQDLPSVRSADLQADLLEVFPHFAAELRFVGRASELASVLRGEQNAVEVLFPGGSTQLAEQVYQESPASTVWNRALATAVRAAAERVPAGRTIRIVEVGGGTGSATSQILPLLAGLRIDYVFTDISPAFFAAARAKFAAYPFVRYVPFNVEAATGTSSDLADADIVVGANVVHATRDLRESLSVLRGLMRRDGTLVLLEGTTVQRFGDLTVGMTEGWWRFTDTERRPDYPLLSRAGWLTLFEEMGLEATATPAGKGATELTANQSIFVATPGSRSGHETSACGWLGSAVGSEAIAGALSGLELPRPIAETGTFAGPGAAGVRDALPRLLSRVGPGSPVIFELPAPSESADVPEQALSAATFALDALQSLLDLEPNSRRSLWFVSRGALPVDAASVHLAGTVLDGLLKTAQVEHPGLALHHADLPAEPAEADWTALARLVQEDSAEITIAVRTSHLVVPRVGHLPANAEPSSLRVDEAAAYLVTGAFGGLGFRTIEWMAERGARCIFAAGRRAPDADLRERIAALNARGVEVIACVADISNADAVAALFAQIASHGRPLRGVIHAAGSVNDATLLQQTPDKLRSVFAAKVRGGYLLHRATEKIALDFFVLYGSAASLLGSAGQANHAAANSFLDALSRFRRLQGLPSVTIGWGAWAEIGAATRINPIHLVSRDGFGLLSVEEGLLLLEEAMGSGHPELAAIRIDWQSARAPGQVRSTWPAFAAFRPADDLPGNDAVRGARSSLQQELEAAPAGDRLGVLKDYIRRSIAETLGSGAAPRDDDQPLTELGLDSLLALQLKNELQTATGVALPGHFFFEYTTIRSAATYIDAKLVAAPEAFRPQDETAYEELAL